MQDHHGSLLLLDITGLYIVDKCGVCLIHTKRWCVRMC